MMMFNFNLVVPIALLGLVLACKQERLKSGVVAYQPVATSRSTIVRDKDEITAVLKGHHIPFDSIFIPTQDEADLPSAKIKSYLVAQISTETDLQRKRCLESILRQKEEYTWFVSGFTLKGNRFVFCYFAMLQDENPTKRNLNSFPIIFDGGESVCQAVFRISDQQFNLLRWNGEA